MDIQTKASALIRLAEEYDEMEALNGSLNVKDVIQICSHLLFLESENAKLKRVVEAARTFMEKHCKCCRRSEFEIDREFNFKEALAQLSEGEK